MLRDGKFFSNVPVGRSRQTYLERQRIDQELGEAVKSPIVSVCAGAGFGKSVAVYSYLLKKNYTTVWLQFSERDNIPARFWENFTTAVGNINQESAAQLAGSGFPETDRQFSRYEKIPLKYVVRDYRYVFVYDDFHVINDSRVLRFMERSITSPFPNITSILISRAEPPIGFGEMSKGGLLSRVTQDSLRFTREELARYFSLLGIAVSAEVLQSIYRDTEGWAFAVRLAALALQKEQDDAAGFPQDQESGPEPARKTLVFQEDYNFRGLRSNIFKLIDREIMPALPEQARHFLVKLSLIDPLPRDLLEELDDSGLVFSSLDAIGSFIRYDDYGNVYRIHNLFLEYLQDKQDALITKDERKEICLRAAAWCIKNRRVVDAIIYFDRAEQYRDLFNAIYRLLPSAIPDHISQVLLGIFDRANFEISETYAAAWIIYLRMLGSTARFDRQVREITERVLPGLEARPPSTKKHALLAGCYSALAMTRFYFSSRTKSLACLDDFKRALHYRNLSYMATEPPASVITLPSWICLVVGPDKEDMDRFFYILPRLFFYAAKTMDGYGWGMSELGRAEHALLREDFDGAEKYSRLALAKAVKWRQYEIENRALFFLARLYLARGDGEGVRDCLAGLEGSLKIPEYLNRHILHDIVCSWIYAHVGLPDRAAAWLKSNFEQGDLHTLLHGFETMVKARCHFAEKRYPAVLATLGNMENNCEVFLFGRIGVKTLGAVCLYRMQDEDGAFDALEEAWALASPQGFYLLFTELGKDMRTLIDAYLRKGRRGIPEEDLLSLRRKASAYAKRLAAINDSFQEDDKEPSPDPSAPDSPLSPRERQVLDGLFRGLTREEIARDLNLSINTVKSTLRSVYGKMGAVNRADAVRRAAAYREADV